jgi:transcriptional regulator with XRE-family HTH domain
VADLRKSLGLAIRASRLKVGLSQERLAELATLDRTYVSSLERGRRNPALSTLERVAEALQVDLSELMRAAERTA